MKIVYKSGGMFSIDDSSLPSRANNTTVKNALYMAIYEEFNGAIDKDKYKNLTNLQKFQKLNEFANNWLKEKGFV